MGFGLVTAGFILLFNPVIHVVDLIPDALGFLLIVIGLTKLSFFIGKIEQARSLFIKLAFVEATKCFMILSVPYASGSDILLQTFVFALLEAFLFVTAINELFEGLSFSGLWYGATAMYEKKVFRRSVVAIAAGWKPVSRLIERITGKPYKKVSRDTKVEWITYAKDRILYFYIFRVCATLVPELTELQLYDNLGDVSAFSIRFSNYKPFLYVILGVTVAILGIRYIRIVSRFFGAVGGDETFIKNLEYKYRVDVLPRDTFFIARGMKQSMTLFVASVFTSIVVTIDDVNILVGVISAAFLIAASVILKRYVEGARYIIPFATVRGVLSLVNLVLQYNYFVEYTVDAVEFVDRARAQYYTMASFECAEAVFAAVGVLMYMFLLLRAIKKHLEICGIQHENAMYSKRNRDIETYNTAGGKLLLCAILAVINFIFAGAYHFIFVNMTLIVIINTAITVLWAVYTWHSLTVISSLLYDKELSFA